MHLYTQIFLHLRNNFISQDPNWAVRADLSNESEFYEGKQTLECMCLYCSTRFTLSIINLKSSI